MNKRTVTKVGDIFEVVIEEGYKKYIQLVAIDSHQLNSDVICVFETKYRFDEKPSIDLITSDRMDFYTHTTVSAGVKWLDWVKIGRSDELGRLDNLIFKHTDDYGQGVEQSNFWRVWGVSGKIYRIGNLTDQYRKTEYGLIFSPESVVERMRTGEVDPYYPG